jgi:hypothetical protein
MLDLIAVTARAWLWRVGMRVVTRRAARMTEHRLILVTRRAVGDFRLCELVWLMATGARGMARRLRGRLCRVTARAARIGGLRCFVHPVAIETAANAPVFRLLLGVAVRACLCWFRRRVRAMALHARLIAMLLGVTLRAALLGRTIRRAEVVAVATSRRIGVAM